MNVSMDSRAHDVLDFWFANAMQSAQAAQVRSKIWFSYNADFDAAILRCFGDLPDKAAAGALDAWMVDAHEALARLIVLDQFPRNLYRNDARAFAYDALALAGSIEAIERGFDSELPALQAVFMYLPFEHAEVLSMQERSVALFEQLRQRAPAGCEAQFDGFVDYAHRHRDIVARFGRFPHRNSVLGRVSTIEETRYLDGGGERFGPKAR